MVTFTGLSLANIIKFSVQIMYILKKKSILLVVTKHKTNLHVSKVWDKVKTPLIATYGAK